MYKWLKIIGIANHYMVLYYVIDGMFLAGVEWQTTRRSYDVIYKAVSKYLVITLCKIILCHV